MRVRVFPICGAATLDFIGTFERVEEAAASIRARCGVLPETAIVLGSGLGDFADTLIEAIATPYGEIPHWPASNVVGHAGRLVIGNVAGKRIAALSGRVHFYEGHDLGIVVFATRVMGRLGVKRMILTNAAGGINTAFAQGALMIIDDHINLLGTNPLIGPNDDRFGPRFPDMSEVYSKRLRHIADEAARARGVDVTHGVYVALHGPSYETPAEIRYLRTIGADAVGMSTVPEAIAARHMGVEVLGISCITNMAAGVVKKKLVHDEVLQVGEKTTRMPDFEWLKNQSRGLQLADHRIQPPAGGTGGDLLARRGDFRRPGVAVLVDRSAEHGMGGGRGGGDVDDDGAGPGGGRGRGGRGGENAGNADNDEDGAGGGRGRGNRGGRGDSFVDRMNPNLRARLEAMLPSGMSLEDAAEGFRNQGQFIAALNASKNQSVDFAALPVQHFDGRSL